MNAEDKARLGPPAWTAQRRTVDSSVAGFDDKLVWPRCLPQRRVPDDPLQDIAHRPDDYYYDYYSP